MIVRISGEGQYRLAESTIDEINRLDAEVEAALDAGDASFADALAALLDKVRTDGELVADDELVGSDVILPAGDATADEVRGMLGDEGLVPG